MKANQEIEALCKKLKPILGSRAEALWYSYLASAPQERRELAVEIEVIAEKYLKSAPLEESEILLPPPSPADSTGSYLVGNVRYKDAELQPLYLRPEDFIKQIGIFAITGEGKTNLAFLQAIQLTKAKVPFLVIDWKRSWRHLLALRDKIPELKDLKVITIGRNVSPLQWNPLRAPPGANQEQWISTVAEALEKSHLSGPGVAYFISKIFPRLYKRAKQEFFPNFFDGIRELEKTSARERELKWKQTAMRIFQSLTIGNAAKVFNARHPTRLENLLDQPIIFELDLELPKPLRIFFSEVLLRWLHLYRLHQGETKNLRHVLFLEEAHNLFPKPYFGQPPSDSLENVYREIRAFGQGLVTITQHPSLLPVYLLGNCHTQIYLGLQHADDIMTARKALFLLREEESYLNQLQVGQAIVKIKNRISPCLVHIPLIRLPSTGISDRDLMVKPQGHLPRLYDGISALTPSLLPTDNKSPQIPPPPAKDPSIIQASTRLSFLLDILRFPLSGTTQRYRRLGVNPKYGNTYKNRLISSGHIQLRRVITSTGAITLLEPTYKGRVALRDAGHEVKEPREGVVHLFWKTRIAEDYRKKGHDVSMEEIINGRPDIIARKDGKRIAIEIETGKSDAVGNIQRALKAGFDEVVSVATEKRVGDKIRGQLLTNHITDNRVKMVSVLNGSLHQ